jgi:hypothetical protein
MTETILGEILPLAQQLIGDSAVGITDAELRRNAETQGESTRERLAHEFLQEVLAIGL